MKHRGGSQPYKGTAVIPGPALAAMKRGRTAGGLNPMDVQRGAQTMVGLVAAETRHRKARKARPAMPARKSS